MSYKEQIKKIREEIDSIDNDLIDIIAKRMKVSKKIGLLKKEFWISSYQQERWKEVLKSRIQAGVNKNLNETFMSEIYELIHKESLRHQI